MDLQERVTRIDYENRLLQFYTIGTLSLLGLTVVLQVRAFEPTKVKPTEQPRGTDRITAKDFVLVDDQGEPRGALRLVVEHNFATVIHKGPFLILSDSSGIRRNEVGCIEGNSDTNSVGFEISCTTGREQTHDL